MSRNTNVKVEAKFLHRTQAAVLVEVDGNEVWLPFACCEVEPEGPWSRGQDVSLEVERWIASERGLC